MTQVATPETAAANFDGVHVDAANLTLEQRGRQLWARFDLRPHQSPPSPPVGTEVEVALITGSHNQQIYWYPTGRGRTLGQLPAIWLVDERRWIPRRAALMHPPGQAAPSETGSWNGICVACHATLGKPGFDTPFGSQPIDAQTVNTSAVEFGIACESCHGPAAAHVSANANPRRRYGLHFTRARDDTIVQPQRLDARRSAEVCGQCHSLWEFSNPAAERAANDHGLPYRPGDDLRTSRLIVQPTTNGRSAAVQQLLADDPGFIRDLFWSDGMVRATGREYNGLIESPCYRNAKDDRHTLTCSSCHSMHQSDGDRRTAAEWADGQLTELRGGFVVTSRSGRQVSTPLPPIENQRCTRCHGPYPSGLTTHTGHRADSPGSLCMNCHMPYTTYGLLKTIRSHQISSPSAAATLATGRPNACNLCHLDKTLAWTAEYLATWYRQPVPALSDDDRSVAASVLTLLKGDAGQRAIIAQSMGWAAARQASGDAWMAPYLALMQNDPYDAVRYIATRALRTLPPFSRGALPRGNSELLIQADGTFDAARVDRLVAGRDNRRVTYRE